ncbi:MAG: hypothetical protein NVS3B18_00100 [Candidatus Dormibacteria bacterium]
MRLEGQHHGLTAKVRGGLEQGGKQGAVTEVDAVEVTDAERNGLL